MTNLKIQHFKYNGFCVTMLPGIAPYTAVFKKWTNDPGVAVFDCSDKKERRIPTCAIIGKNGTLPKQSYKNKVIFGLASNS